MWFTTDFVAHGTIGGELAGFTVTKVGSSSFALIDGAGGLACITTGATANDGVNAQASAVFQVGTPATDLRDVALHARVKLSDATNTELFLGFAATDTTILAGVTDSLGWRKAAGSTDLKGVIESSSTETLTAALATAGTSWVRLGCYLEAANARVMFTVNGALVHEEKTLSNLPSSTLLAPSIAFRTSAAATKTLDIDWLHLWQGGR